MSKELERAAKEYSMNGEYQFMSTFQQMAQKAFIAGANWQASNTNMSTIGLEEIAELNDGLAYLFNALEHNDESEHSEKIDKAISLLNEVETDLICHCSVPKAAIPISQNKCEKCGKRLHLSYCG